jgi:DALR domain
VEFERRKEERLRMKLFNTKTQQIESLQPGGDEIALCLCGPKPTEPVQLDQAYLYSTIDILVRYLEEMKGWTVKYAQLSASLSGSGTDGRQPPKNRRAGHFIEHMRFLNVRPPDRSLESIDDYRAMFARYPEQSIDLCIDSVGSPFGCDSAQTGPASSQARPIRFRMQVATIEHVEPVDSRWGMVTLGDMLEYFSADAIRVYMAQHHYRSPWAHDEVILEKAAQYSERLKAAMDAIGTGDRSLNTTPARNRFMAALDNDLDTRKGMATLLNLADEILFRAPNGYSIDDAQDALRQMASVFGLRLDTERPEERVVNGWADYRQHSETA